MAVGKTKVMVNVGRTLSVKGVPYVGGSVVDVADDKVGGLVRRGIVSDPAKPAKASPAELAMASFKANPPEKKSKGDGDGSQGGSVDDAVQSLLT